MNSPPFILNTNGSKEEIRLKELDLIEKERVDLDIKSLKKGLVLMLNTESTPI